MAKRSVIILHGWGLSGERYSPLVDQLRRKGYQVFAPDLPGFGKSQKPTYPYELKDYVGFLDTYMKHRAIQKTILIGHSFGGRVALKYQLLYPDKVKGLILTGTPGYTPVPRKKLVVFVAVAKIGKFICSIPPISIFQDAIRKWYYYAVGARDYYRAEGVMKEVFKRVVKEDLSDAMKHVRAPCLLVWGSEDVITPPWIALRMKESIPHAQLIVIPDADHGVSFKRSDIFMDSIENFLSRI